MVGCEMAAACSRPATRRLVIEYPCGETCEEFYCHDHAEEVQTEFDLDDVDVVETEPLG